MHTSNIVHNGKQLDKKIDIANQLNNFLQILDQRWLKNVRKNSKIVQGMDEKNVFQPTEPFSDFFIQGSRRII